MPSRQEGFGLVYLEAMNFGKPCVGSRDDGAEDVIVDGMTGCLVRNPRDTDEMEGVLASLLGDPERAAAMGRRGLERLRSNFTAEHYRRRLAGHLAPFLRTAVARETTRRPLRTDSTGGGAPPDRREPAMDAAR